MENSLSEWIEILFLPIFFVLVAIVGGVLSKKNEKEKNEKLLKKMVDDLTEFANEVFIKVDSSLEISEDKKLLKKIRKLGGDNRDSLIDLYNEKLDRMLDANRIDKNTLNTEQRIKLVTALFVQGQTIVANERHANNDIFINKLLPKEIEEFRWQLMKRIIEKK